MLRSANVRGFGVFLVMLACCTRPPSSLQAASLMSGWRVINESSATVGYDSNVLRAQDEDGDGLLSFGHSVELTRDRGLLRAELEADVLARFFFDDSDANGIDGGFTFQAEYPNEIESVSGWEAGLHARTDKLARADTETRYRRTTYGGSAERRWAISPKTAATGSVTLAAADYSSDDYRSVRAIELGAGLAHARRPGLGIDAVYTLELGRSRGIDRAPEDIDLVGHTLGVALDGEILPKLDGRLFVGATHASFSKGFENDEFGPSVQADLIWEAGPRLTVALGALHHVNFSPQGDARRETRLRVRATQEIRGGFQLVVTLAPSWATFEREVRLRREDELSAGASLEYALTERFFAALSVDWIDNDSTDAAYEFTQTLVQFTAGIRY